MKAFVADTADGYQALCPPHWAGEMQTLWFEARFDAIAHSLAVHNTAPFVPVTPWLDLLKGPPDEHTDRAGADPDDARRAGHSAGPS